LEFTLNKNTRPLVSFIVVAYNQKQYIEEAIRGAFAQTYQPLEIILSDDNSSDNTFAIMQRLADEYEGPHCVVLNENNQNLGLIGHLNKAFELSTGQLLVMNAGDDISLKERTRNVYQAWLDSNHRGKTIVSSLQPLSLQGEFIRKPLIRDKIYRNADARDFITNYPGINGAACSYDRKVIEKFGLLNITSLEDRSMAFRSILIGDVIFIPNVDVLYRDGGMSDVNNQNWAANYHGRVYMQLLHDLDNICVDINKNDLQYLKGFSLAYLSWTLKTKSFLNSAQDVHCKFIYICYLLRNPFVPSMFSNIKMMAKVILNKLR
jgi:glycosyltransferase involved in cell wall biosynthesis